MYQIILIFKSRYQIIELTQNNQKFYLNTLTIFESHIKQFVSISSIYNKKIKKFTKLVVNGFIIKITYL